MLSQDQLLPIKLLYRLFNQYDFLSRKALANQFIVVTAQADNSPFYNSWKVTKLLHETEAKVYLTQLEKWKL